MPLKKEEALKEFQENVAYLRRNVPPDDIYAFAEQMLRSAHLFLIKWNTWEDLQEVCEKDEVLKGWIMMIHGILTFQKEKVEAPLIADFDLSLEDDN